MSPGSKPGMPDAEGETCTLWPLFGFYPVFDGQRCEFDHDVVLWRPQLGFVCALSCGAILACERVKEWFTAKAAKGGMPMDELDAACGFWQNSYLGQIREHVKWFLYVTTPSLEDGVPAERAGVDVRKSAARLIGERFMECLTFFCDTALLGPIVRFFGRSGKDGPVAASFDWHRLDRNPFFDVHPVGAPSFDWMEGSLRRRIRAAGPV